jgi:ketosteroid isomerase-like protein
VTTNKALIEGLYAGFAQGDIPAVLGAFADDIAWVEPEGHPLGGTFVGPQAVVDGVFTRLGEIGDEFAVVAEQLVADGDTVAAPGHMSWRSKGSGAPASVKMVHVWTVQGGKVTAFENHTDTVRMRELM